MITALSLLWMMLNCSAMSLWIYILRTKTEYISKYGFYVVKFLVMSCLIRLLAPLEIPGFRYPPGKLIFCSDAERMLYSMVESMFSRDYFPFFSFLWFCGSIYYGIRLYVCSRNALLFIREHSYDAPHHVLDILRSIDSRCPALIRICPMINRSYLVGYQQLTIYLPEYFYSDEELYYILLHEYTHWKRKDIWKKALMNICCIIAWWNPAVHLIRREISQLIEFECDSYLSENFSDEEVISYLNTLLSCIRNAQDSFLDKSLDNFASFTGTSKVYMSKHRFKLLIDRDSENRHKVLPKAVIILLDIIWLFSSYYYIPRVSYYGVSLLSYLSGCLIYIM